jgi:hypothetical protein
VPNQTFAGWFGGDTPASRHVRTDSRCPIGKDTCGRGRGEDPIHNYADCSDDACHTQFTAGQTERAQKQFAHSRFRPT